MKLARLRSMLHTAVSFDLETHLTQPGLPAPPPVLGSIAMYQNEGIVGELLGKRSASAAFMAIVRDAARVLVGANIQFDVLVQAVYQARLGVDIMPLVLEMYDAGNRAVTGDVDGRVFDALIGLQLSDIAGGWLGTDPRTGKQIINPETGKRGRYSLAYVTSRLRGRDNAKINDRFRQSYALFDATLDEAERRGEIEATLAQLPDEARTYPVDDAVNTHENALALVGAIESVGVHDWREEPGAHVVCRRCGASPGAPSECRAAYAHDNLHDHSRQVYMDLCLRLGAAWGLATDQAAVDALEAAWQAEHTPEAMQEFVDAGIVRPDGTVNESHLKKLVARAYGATAPCPTCAGTGKVPSPKTEGRTKINCKACDGTALELPDAVPRADAGGVGKGRDVLNESGDNLLGNYAAKLEGQKIPKTYIPWLRGRDRDGALHPGVPLITSTRVLLETGRSANDTAGTLPRTGGVRECIVARAGRVLSSNDYPAGELITHAQSCLWIVGDSELARALNNGLDAHLDLAAFTLGISYEEATSRRKAKEKRIVDQRQIEKPPNFGYPGRMGPARLVIQQRRQNDVHTPDPNGPSMIPDGKGGKIRGWRGLRFCLVANFADRCGIEKVAQWNGRDLGGLYCKRCIEYAVQARKNWLMKWPENVAYFDHVKRVDESGMPQVQHVSKRLRGFRQGQIDENDEPINSGNAIANGYFQALLADAAKNAYMAATRECYDPTVRIRSHVDCASRWEGYASPLYGSRLPLFAHDEIIGDHPADVAPEAAWRNAELMEESLEIFCPNMVRAIRGKVRPALMRKLYKSAEEKYENGRLVPWEPK